MVSGEDQFTLRGKEIHVTEVGAAAFWTGHGFSLQEGCLELGDDVSEGSKTSDQLELQGAQRGPRTGSKKAVMSDPMESLWQGMLQETPQKLERRDMRRPLALGSVVFEAIGDGLLVVFNDLIVGNGCLLCIPAEITNDVDRSFGTGAAVNDPFLGPLDLGNRRIDGSCPFEKDGAKDFRESSDVEQKVAVQNAIALIRIDHECGNQDMDMRMPDEGAPPGVKCSHESELSMQLAGCDLLYGICDSRGQCIEKFLGLLADDLAELSRDGKGHMEIRHRQNLVGTLRNPHVDFPVAAGRTHGIPAGVRVVEAERAIIAHHRMATH